MKEIFTMWKYPRMVMYVAVSAILYAVVLVPFKGWQMIPGIAEIRPAAVIPPILGILFGPAGAWGCALGNTIGDYFGHTLTQGSYFGAIGNFFFALVAYIVWYKQNPSRPDRGFMLTDAQDIGRYAAVCCLSCAAVSLVIAWGLEFLTMSAFGVIGSLILLNNLAATIILGPFLLKLFYSRARAWKFLWQDAMPPEAISSSLSPTWSGRLMWIGVVGGLAVGLFVSHAIYQNPFLDAEGIANTDPAVLLLSAPFLILFLLGCLLA